jgi:hypothetical protein
VKAKGIPVNSKILGFCAIFLPSLALAACGGSGTSDGTGGKGGTGGGTGGEGTTGDTNGGGGTGGTATGGGGTGGTATGGTGGTATGGGGTGGASTCGMPGPEMDACLDDADQAIVMDMTKDLGKISGDCAKANLADCQKAYDCIQMGTGFTDECTTCFNNNVQCVIANCIGECISDSNSQPCLDCRAEKCDPAFAMCSGLKQ